MHTITRPIYISRQGDLFRVTAYKGWVTAPKVREFERYEEAVAYANKTFATRSPSQPLPRRLLTGGSYRGDHL